MIFLKILSTYLREPIEGIPDSIVYPTTEPNVFCDPGWHYILNENGKIKCFQIQGNVKSWQNSEDICISKGAHLMSINSPKELEVSNVFSLFPSAYGNLFQV